MNYLCFRFKVFLVSRIKFYIEEMKIKRRDGGILNCYKKKCYGGRGERLE